MKKMTVIIYDAGFKKTSPALPSLSNQTIKNDCQFIWLELYDKVFPEVKKYDFIQIEKLNMISQDTKEISYCYNKGLEMAEGKYFVLCDPCLWLKEDCLEYIYNFHENNEKCFTFNHEHRGRDENIANILTKTYIKNANEKYKNDIFKIKKGNMGCMSTTLTEYYRGVGGFDIIGKQVTNHLKLCMIRMKNKYSLREVGLDDIVYHPFHPRGKKPEKVLMKKIVEKYKNEKTIRAKI